MGFCSAVAFKLRKVLERTVRLSAGYLGNAREVEASEKRDLP